MNKTTADEIAEMYNQFGRCYHQSRSQGRIFNEYLEVPAALQLLPDLQNKVVLDAGCGSGIYARKLAKLGAEIIGVDISETMIAIANEEKLNTDNISYHVGNLENLNWLNANTVDLIMCNYVLENIEDILPIFKEFYRLLKPGGNFIFSISHPLRAAAKRFKQANEEIWQLENYYDHSIRISDFGGGLKIKKYKRTIADYITATIQCGFVITDYCEPQPIPDGKEVDRAAYDTAMRLPQVLLVKLVK